MAYPILNPSDEPAAAHGAELAAELLDRARAAKGEAITSDGIRYGPEVEAALHDLRRCAAQLTAFDPYVRLRDRNTALAFWINLYNAMTIHGALAFRVQRVMTEIPRFFKRTVYDIGGQRFNLDVIEHGLLRANRGHPLRFGPQLWPWDRRRALVLRPMDLRIHFALNCGATSCPPIRHYTAKDIDAELQAAAEAFVAVAGAQIDGGVTLSRIFFWYSRDFGWTKRRQLARAISYLDEAQRPAVEAAAARGIRYAPYDWSFA